MAPTIFRSVSPLTLRCTSVGVVTALVLAGAGCAPPRPLLVTAPTRVAAVGHERAPRERFRWYDSYWRAVEDLNIHMASLLADDPDQRSFADALQRVLNGDGDGEHAITPLLTSSDSLVRRAARVTYGALLAAQSDWPRLAAWADTAGDAERDAAGVQAWAPAFRRVRPTVVFQDSVAILPLERAPTGVPVIPVTVNGVVRHFWLDTGSSITILSSAVADDVQVVGDTLELLTAVGRLRGHPAVVRTLGIGGARVHDAAAVIVDPAALTLRGDPGGARGVDGVIGFDVIRTLDLTIDDAHDRVIVRRPVLLPPDQRRTRTLVWFGVPIVSLTSEDGVPMHLLLDTGADETYGTRQFVLKTKAENVPGERRVLRGFGGTAQSERFETGFLVPYVKLFLGNTPLRFERVFLYEAQYPTIFVLDGTLGADVGRGGQVHIDMTNGRFEVGP